MKVSGVNRANTWSRRKVKENSPGTVKVKVKVSRVEKNTLLHEMVKVRRVKGNTLSQRKGIPYNI